MVDLRERFAPLMAETLCCAGSAEWLEKPLSEANSRLLELAERERATPLFFADSDSQAYKKELEQARFAVMAWADEQMLASSRADAASWAAMSLQFHYFSTAEAGRLFYQELEKCLDARGIARRVRVKSEESRDSEDFNRETQPEREEWRVLSLAERIEAAASAHRTGSDEGALAIFALCLLYGFRGALYGDPATLARIRRACRALFDGAPALGIPPQRSKSSDWLLWGERIAYLLVPVLVCLLFAVYCGGVLANAPFRGGF